MNKARVGRRAENILRCALLLEVTLLLVIEQPDPPLRLPIEPLIWEYKIRAPEEGPVCQRKGTNHTVAEVKHDLLVIAMIDYTPG